MTSAGLWQYLYLVPSPGGIKYNLEIIEVDN